jgi:CubicO group peptidase (beta-lactamase class C family)
MQKALFGFLLSLICASGFAQIYTDPLKTRLDTLLGPLNDKDPGGYIFVQKGNDLLYYRQFGVANIATKEKFDDFTLVNIGGLGRTFIAYSILILQQEGKLDLEDSLLKYIPDFKNKQLGAKIKIRHLLTHTSGLKDLPTQHMDSVHFLTITDKENFELVKYTNKPSFEPGANFQFSEQAFSALVIILEKVSGMSWQEFVTEKILAKAGMTTTKLVGKPGDKVSAAAAYRLTKGKYVEYDQGEALKMYTAANGGIWSTIVDLRKYAYALQYCLFLKCENVKTSTDVLTPFNWYSQAPLPVSQCWFVNQIPGLEYQNLSYEGVMGGYRTSFVVIPQSELYIIILSNNSTTYTNKVLEVLKYYNHIK